mgnify:CR=1 FL=1
MFVSVTRLRIRSRRFLPRFAYYTWAVVRQARRSDGFVGGRLARGGERPLPAALLYGRIPSFWTITAWEDEGAMRSFRNASAHREVMPKLVEWCSEASTVHWEQESRGLPDAERAVRRMLEDGRLTGVRHPSEAQAAGEIPPVAGLRGEIPLPPVRG